MIFTPPVLESAPLADESVEVSFKMPPAPLAEKSLSPAAPAATKETSKLPSYWQDAKRYISVNEGVKNQVYLDSKKLPTVGIGHLIRPGELKKYENRVLNMGEIEELFQSDLSEKEKLAKSKLGKAFDEMPDQLKVAVLDGFFRGDLTKSDKTLKLLKAGKYAEAADEYLDHDEYRASVALNRAGTRHGVAGRMERNAAQMRLAARKIAKPR
jgi:GH24 family phage-related lysozyme (muramidase)